jgi:hypothetical protein
MLPPVNTTSMVGRVEMETPRLPSRSTFQTDILSSQPFRNRFNIGSCPEPEINCYMGHYVQTNRECDKTKNWSFTSIRGNL